VTVHPLAGVRVVVTRSRGQASSLVAALRSLGASVVELPVISVEDPPDLGVALDEAAARVAAGAYRWVVCTSANAAERFVRALGHRPIPPSTQLAAVGAATARVLGAGGRPADLVPATATAAALADAFPDPPEPGAQVLFPRAAVVGDVLATALRARGWVVDEAVAYRTVEGNPPEEAVAEARHADVVAFTSSSTAERFAAIVGVVPEPPSVVSIGPVTSATARRLGFSIAGEAVEHTIPGLVAAIVDVVRREGRAGRPET